MHMQVIQDSSFAHRVQPLYGAGRKESSGTGLGVSIQSSINLGDALEKKKRPDSWRGCLYINHLPGIASKILHFIH